MRKFKFLMKCTLSFIIALLFCAIPFMPKYIDNNELSFAADIVPEIDPRTTSTRSTFIHSPTYSVIYNNNVYFFDEYDCKLKKYNLNSSNLEENTLNISDLDYIVDVEYLGEYIFVLSKTKNQENNFLKLTIINLTNFTIEKTIELENLSEFYKAISICEIDENYLISLSPENNKDLIFPVVLTLNKTSLEISNICVLQINELILNKLFNFLIIESAGTNENDVYLILTFFDKIYFYGTTLINLTTEESLNIDTSKSSLSSDLETTNANTKIASINTIVVDNNQMLLISYYVTDDSGVNISGSYSKLYEYLIDATDQDKSFKSVLTFSINGIEYITTSNGCLLYPLKNEQQIVYTEILYNSQNQIYSDKTPQPYIKNPNIEQKYYSESEFKYAITNKSTKLLTTNPWAFNNNNNVDLSDAKDVIVIGKGIISGENSLIDGFDYCMITTADRNIKGYIKSQDLTLKQEISIENYDYKVFKVQPNTFLYSLPTTIEEYGITDTLNSRIIKTIEDNSKVEVIDAISKYKSNEKIMLKVKVNNNDIGYIEYDKIIKPSNSFNFVITNASIKSDDVNVYLNSSDSSPIISTLNKGYRIRINGSRNTETGYTSITFNDEFGNEFTGYILTDTINSDSWTTMQIIGCILIAINLGLLILILKFKNKNIGNDGSKYIDNKNKSNKKH